MIDVVTLGETMALVRTDHSGDPENGSRATIGFGGADSNVAIGLARLGHQVRWISAVGDDAFGRMLTSEISSQGVDVIARVSKQSKTGLMVKSPSVTADRFVAFYRAGSAASTMGPADISEDRIAGAKVLHLTGITPLLSGSCSELIREVLQLAKRFSLFVSFDINYRATLFDRDVAKSSYREIVKSADLVFGDEQELAMLVGDYADRHELMQKVSKLGPRLVVLKLGADGAIALSNGEFFEQPAIKVEVVDTVGAGDGFVAGFLSGHLDNADIEECLFRAAFCGAQVCTDLGDWEGAPTRQQLELARGELVR